MKTKLLTVALALLTCTTGGLTVYQGMQIWRQKIYEEYENRLLDFMITTAKEGKSVFLSRKGDAQHLELVNASLCEALVKEKSVQGKAVK